jgi:hypothetical protein
MIRIAPPAPPFRVTLADDDALRRFHLRLWLIWMTLLTVLVTAWLVSLGTVPAVIGLVTAKHVLVAILVRGLEVDGQQQAEG